MGNTSLLFGSLESFFDGVICQWKHKVIIIRKKETKILLKNINISMVNIKQAS